MARTDRSNGIATALLIAGLMLAAGLAGGSEIAMCEHANFRGKCITLRHGVGSLRQWGMNDKISSLRIMSGRWLICTDNEFQGRCETFRGSAENLSGTPFQDRISSLRPIRSGWDDRGGSETGYGGGSHGTAIAIYTDVDFRGRSYVVGDDIENLRSIGLNDRVSSIRVLGGQWEICVDSGFRNCQRITGDVDNLKTFGWNDRISSVRELGGGRSFPFGEPDGGRGHWRDHGGSRHRGRLTLFSDPGFQGRSLAVDSTQPDLGRFNNRASSIRVEGSEQWLVCTKTNFRGRCQVIDRNHSALPRKLNDRIKSVRPN